MKPHVTGRTKGGMIVDSRARSYPFGDCVLTWRVRERHRWDYTLADAEAVAAWLREREAGYPPLEALMPTQASPS